MNFWKKKINKLTEREDALKKEFEKVKKKLADADDLSVQIDLINSELEELKDKIELVALKPLTQATQVEQAEKDIEELQRVVSKLKKERRKRTIRRETE